ncbi:hypothetical protein FBR05_13715 [Deltaproteobacteria bacterium PRO3]|nr:MAG: hypothetical protein F9K50_00845 [bacterium]MDL1873234.1 hypothetical protein [Deltaproteobacteria bacterium PRO3]
MQIELTMKEKQYLENMLMHHMRELSREISHTDNRSFKENLKEEAEVLRVLQSKLEQERAMSH